jgi:hypothetical protein
MTTLFQKTKGLVSVLVAISMAIATFIPVHASRIVPKAVAITSDAVVLEWNEIAINAILPNGPPFTAARFMTIVQLAVFEAVNSISGKYQPYLGLSMDGVTPR